MNFVNQKLDRLGLSVQSLDTQVGTRLREGPQGAGGKRAPQAPGAGHPHGLQCVTSRRLGVCSPRGVSLAAASPPRATVGTP